MLSVTFPIVILSVVVLTTVTPLKGLGLRNDKHYCKTFQVIMGWLELLMTTLESWRRNICSNDVCS